LVQTTEFLSFFLTKKNYAPVVDKVMRTKPKISNCGDNRLIHTIHRAYYIINLSIYSYI
jgi:hypothetical protein